MAFFQSETYGGAQAADAVELKRKGFFKEGGFYLGEWGEGVFSRSLFHNRDGHILTVAPPGSGKTTGIIIPNLLTYRDGSLIVTDPKGSVTAQTARYREQALGNRVVILNPWRQELSSSMGRDLGETGFNPLYLVNRCTPSVIDDAEAAASMMIPIPPTMSEADRYWPETAQTVATGVMIWLAFSDKGGATLPKLYEIARYGKKDWQAVCEEMRRVSTVDLDTYANAIEGLLEAEKQWQGVVGKFQSATSIYNPAKSLGAHVSKDEFNPLDLKKENVTVYVVIPNNRRDANAGWLSLVLQTMAQAVGQPGQARPVLLIAEEFANLGYMPTISSAMAEYREAGLRCHLVIQTLSQLNRIYTPAGADEIKTLCAIRQFFAVNDPVAAKDIEIFSGTITKARDDNPMSDIGQPLIPAHEVMRMNDDDQIIIVNGTNPIRAKVVPYFKRRKMQGVADPNPYREDEGEYQEGRSFKDTGITIKPDTMALVRNIALGIGAALLLMVILIPSSWWQFTIRAGVIVGLIFTVLRYFPEVGKALGVSAGWFSPLWRQDPRYRPGLLQAFFGFLLKIVAIPFTVLGALFISNGRTQLGPIPQMIASAIKLVLIAGILLFVLGVLEVIPQEVVIGIFVWALSYVLQAWGWLQGLFTS